MAAPEKTVVPDDLVDKIIARLRSQDDFSDAEIEALKSAALFIISMRTTGAVFKVVVKVALWSGWLILLAAAWKNGNLPAVFSNWPHP